MGSAAYQTFVSASVHNKICKAAYMPILDTCHAKGNPILRKPKARGYMPYMPKGHVRHVKSISLICKGKYSKAWILALINLLYPLLALGCETM